MGLEINIYDDNLGMVCSVYMLLGGESFIVVLVLVFFLVEVI